VNRAGATQTVIWVALGILSFLFLKWRDDDIEGDAIRLNPAVTDSGVAVRHLDSLPKPFERLRAPLFITPRKIPPKPKVARLRAQRGDSVPVSVTAYCLQGRTRSGRAAKEGTAAADPRVFALNSEIDLLIGGQLAGRYRVEDTGLLIKGRTIDIWLADCTEARNFGRKRGIATLAPKIRR
jgi:3D (Asp-Asp-Asp) domain-containing protein